MEDMITYVCDFVGNISNNESLNSIISEKMENNAQGYPPIHFFLTDLCNPIQTYYQRTKPEIKKPIELKKELEYGTKLHNDIKYWFRKLKGYIVEEGVLDGALVGIKGVRGRVDARFGNSIMEYKTKDELPKNVLDLIEKYPQDIEQISFYSILYKKPLKTNYLIFVSNKKPFKLIAFKITTKDPEKIKILLVSRISKLKSALEKRDPSTLNKCRYYNKICPFKESCLCASLVLSSPEQLKEALDIEYDAVFTNELEQLKKEALKTKNFFTIRDIILPRKYGVEDNYVSDLEVDMSKNFLLSLVRKLDFGLNPSEMEKVVSSLQESKIKIAYRWLKIDSSLNSERKEILPYIITVNSNKEFTKISKYRLAELGIISALYGKNKGIIFDISPKIDNTIRVFEVTYKNNNTQIVGKVKEIIKYLEQGNIATLPPNPSWVK